MTEHSGLSIKGLCKRYGLSGAQRTVLDNIDLTIAGGEFVSIVGPSGCGKSTLLRLLVGLDADYEGSIALDDKEIRGASLARGIVFQDHRLLPWLTLSQNIALALTNVPWDAERKRASVRDQIALVGLEGYEDAYPHQLSGGMAQRAAIARGLVSQPEVLLLDEPLGSLDALTRVRLQDEMARIWRTEKVTMVLVTHDIEEAITLSSRIVVLSANPGRIHRQIDVGLPYPRDRASYAVADVRREVIAALGGAA